MRTTALVAALAATVLGGIAAHAQIVPLSVGDFSPAATVIDFSLPAGNEQQITNQYASLGVTFSGALYTMRNAPDVNDFAANGGQIASNWRYSGGGIAGTTIDIWFAAGITRIGVYSKFWSTDSLTASLFNGSALLGSASMEGNIPMSPKVLFYGVQTPVPFDHVQLSISGPGNNFIAFDNLMFERAISGPSGAVPEPSTYGLLAAGVLLGIAFWRRQRR